MADSGGLDTDAVGARVEGLLDELAAVAGDQAVGIAEEVVAELMGLYGAGLARVVELARTQGGESLPAALADDELVAGLLVLHDLHPTGVRERVEAAVAGVRDHLRARGDDVEVVGIAGDVVRVRFDGLAGGCGTSELVSAIERAVQRGAPEISRVEVEEAPQLIPAESVTLRRDFAPLDGGAAP